MKSRVFSTAEVIELLNVGRASLYRYIEEGLVSPRYGYNVDLDHSIPWEKRRMIRIWSLGDLEAVREAVTSKQKKLSTAPAQYWARQKEKWAKKRNAAD